MNGYMAIRVEVLARQARAQIAALNAEMLGMSRAANRATVAQAGIGSGAASAGLVRYGNALQYTGRQLFRNFSLPLIAAGAAGVKFALDQQKALVSVSKVYGDLGAATEYWGKHTTEWQNKVDLNGKKITSSSQQATDVFNRELKALDGAFGALSERYAIQKKQVLEVAGAWAAAGVSGKALAESVDTTLRASSVGDMSTVKAGEALISIQAQYNLSSKQLSNTLDQLNAVENATGANMQDLITGFQRSAGVAASFGVSTRYLAADIAALTPAAGSAATAGNGLKTIFTRLMAPTTKAKALFKEMGLEINSKAWRSSNAQQRLIAFSKEFNKLDSSGKGVAASIAFGNYQISRASILMDANTRSSSYYFKALDATSTQSKATATAQRELTQVLDSQPKKLARVGVALQNSLADIMVPLIPYIVSMAQGISNMVRGFQSLSPEVQKLGLGLALFLVLMPLLTIYIGSFATLFGTIGKATSFLMRGLGMAKKGQTSAAVSTQSLIDELITLAYTMQEQPFEAFAARSGSSFEGLAAVVSAAAAEIITILEGMAATLIRIEESLATSRTSIVAAGALARIAEETTEATVRVATAATASAAIIALEAGASAERAASMMLFNQYRLLLATNYNAAMFGIEAGGSASRLAIEAGTSARTVAIEGTGAVARVGIFSRMWAALSGIAVRGAGVVIAIFSGLGQGIVAALAAAGITASVGMVAIVAVIVAAILGLAYIFRKQLGDGARQAVIYAVKMFNLLPQGIQNALIATVNIVKQAALAVYSWFSYLNPWAHHSPSLVENVTTGMAEVMRQFGVLSNVEGFVKRAYSALQSFGSATAGFLNSVKKTAEAADRALISKNAGGGAAKQYDVLIGKLHVLEDQYDRIGKAVQSMQNAIAAPMQAMDDQIFANTMAQKKLQLQILQSADAYGGFDNAVSKISALNGEIETLRGTQTDLRNAGAGSDITSFYDDQMKALEAQKKPIQDNVNQIDQMKAALAALQKQGDILDLQKSVNFDEPLRAIDLMKAKYDLVGGAIDAIKSKISDVAQASQSIETAKKSAGGSGVKGAGGGSGALSKGNFPSVKGSGINTKYDGKDQIKGIKKFTDDMIKDTAKKFGAINPFKPLVTKAKNAWNSISDGAKGIASKIADSIGGSDVGSKVQTGLNSTVKTVGDFANKFKSAFSALWSFIGPELGNMIKSFAEGLQAGWKILAPSIKGLWKDLQPLAQAFGNLFKAVKKSQLGNVLKIIGVAFLVLSGIIIKLLAGGIGQAFKLLFIGIALVLKGVVLIVRGVVKVVTGLVNIFASLINGNIGQAILGIGQVFLGVGRIILGVFITIAGIVASVLGPIVGFIWGVLKAIWNAFVWIYNVLVGHSIVPDLVNGIVACFKLLGTLGQWIWDNVLHPIVQFFVHLWNRVVAGLQQWWAWIQAAWAGLKGAGQWIWNNVAKPVVDFFGRGITNIVHVAGGAWGLVKGAFSGLKTMGKWVYDNALKPLWDKFKSIFNSIGGWIKDNVKIIVSPFKTMINSVITIINKMIDGLNMLSKLPGIDFKVSHIPKLAAGGAIPKRQVGNGWVTNGARAIVGEGKANHPEYVIPTDPTHRGRATKLYNSLGQKLGLVDNKKKVALDTMAKNAKDQFGIPMYDVGGILNAIGGKAKDIAKGVKGSVINVGGKAFNWATDHLGKAASFIYRPFGKIVDGLIGKIGQPIEGGMKYVHHHIRDLVTAADQKVASIQKVYGGGWKKPLNGGYSIGGGIGSYPGHNGQDFPVASGTPVHAVTGGTVTASADLRGNQSGGYRSYGRYVEIQHANGLKSLYAHNSSRNVSKGQHVVGGQVISHSGNTGHTTGPHLHLSMWQNGALKSPLGILKAHGVHMADGGIVPPKIGGTLITAGEAGQHEAVIPLTSKMKNGFGTENNFYGDLVFPNVKDGANAEAFLRNLESQIKD